MGYRMTLSRNFSRIALQKIGFSVVTACILLSMALLLMSIPRPVPLHNLSMHLSFHPASTSVMAKERAKSHNLGSQNKVLEESTTVADPKLSRGGLDGNIGLTNISSTTNTDFTDKREDVSDDFADKREDISDLKKFGSASFELHDDIMLEKNSSFTAVNSTKKNPESDNVDQKDSSTAIIGFDHNEENYGIIADKNSSGTIVNSTLEEHIHRNNVIEKNMSIPIQNNSTTSNASSNVKQDSNGITVQLQLQKPLCNFSDPRYDICEIEGDIRIHGYSSSVISINYPQLHNAGRNESWQIRPYARKGDETALSHVRQVVVSSSDEGPFCTLNHTIPAIIFSVTGFTGNLFHDFTDVLVPLFLTAHRYNGEVQFLVTDMNIWWVRKYRHFLQALSRYEVIDFNKDHRVHCFKHATVGLHAHKEFSIDPSRPPMGYSMADFMQFMRHAYSLERGRPIRLGESPGKKPRLLLIARKRTRTFLNVDEIADTARELGFEVVIGEAGVSSDVAEFARIVNSCDVMMGVHGAGLANLAFLPVSAVVIQIVPWGGLEWICMLDFGEAAKDGGLKYLQYSIRKEESSLIEVYPREHPVFKDPLSYHNKGWDVLREMFMDKQNVRLDVRRFRAVLMEALEHLKQENS